MKKLHLIEVCYGSSLLMDTYYRSGRSTLVHNTGKILSSWSITSLGGGFLKDFCWNFSPLNIGEDELNPMFDEHILKKGVGWSTTNQMKNHQPPTINHQPHLFSPSWSSWSSVFTFMIKKRRTKDFCTFIAGWQLSKETNKAPGSCLGHTLIYWWTIILGSLPNNQHFMESTVAGPFLFPSLIPEMLPFMTICIFVHKVVSPIQKVQDFFQHRTVFFLGWIHKKHSIISLLLLVVVGCCCGCGCGCCCGCCGCCGCCCCCCCCCWWWCWLFVVVNVYFFSTWNSNFSIATPRTSFAFTS